LPNKASRCCEEDEDESGFVRDKESSWVRSYSACTRVRCQLGGVEQAERDQAGAPVEKGGRSMPMEKEKGRSASGLCAMKESKLGQWCVAGQEKEI
jgi:hypothetical protein